MGQALSHQRMIWPDRLQTAQLLFGLVQHPAIQQHGRRATAGCRSQPTRPVWHSTVNRNCPVVLSTPREGISGQHPGFPCLFGGARHCFGQPTRFFELLCCQKLLGTSKLLARRFVGRPPASHHDDQHDQSDQHRASIGGNPRHRVLFFFCRSRGFHHVFSLVPREAGGQITSIKRDNNR